MFPIFLFPHLFPGLFPNHTCQSCINDREEKKESLKIAERIKNPPNREMGNILNERKHYPVCLLDENNHIVTCSSERCELCFKIYSPIFNNENDCPVCKFGRQ